MHVIIVRVRDAYEVDLRKALEVQAWFLLSSNRPMPLGPIRVKDDGLFSELEKERGVSDPSHSHVFFFRRASVGLQSFALRLAKHLGNHTMPPEAIGTPSPTFFWENT